MNVRFKDEQFTYRGKQYEMPFLGLADKSRFRLNYRIVFPEKTTLERILISEGLVQDQRLPFLREVHPT